MGFWMGLWRLFLFHSGSAPFCFDDFYARLSLEAALNACPARAGLFSFLLDMTKLLQAQREALVGGVQVLHLGAALGGGDDETRGAMVKPHARPRFVAMLSARSRGYEEVDVAFVLKCGA
jgi:hypothetical protein